MSSHSGPEPLSSLVPKAVFEVDAGRNRAVSVNVPVMFEAVARGAAEGFGARWSFGDGTFARGRSAEHVYDYAGSFVVLLRATRRGDGVVSYDRLSLTTFVPRVSVVSEGSRAWLRNDSGRELNLDGFSYRAGRHRVRFEGDVVVPAGERVPLAEGASPCALEILYPNGAPLLPNACEGGVQSVHDG